MKKKLLLYSLALLPLCGSAQTEVTPYMPGVTVEGVTYCLPKTALRFTVVAEKEVYTPGEYAKYADRYLRLKDVDFEGYTRWTIKSIKVEPYGVPDKNKIYSIALKKRTVAPLVKLTKDGILLAINTDKEAETLPELPKAQPAEKLLNPRNFMNQEILAAGSSAKIAELTAQEIYDIRDSRNALIRGEADNTPKDGAQLKLMLDQLNKQEEALSQLFAGYKQKSTEVFSFTTTPEQEMEHAVLFRFSEKLGVVSNEDLAGEPIYIDLKSAQEIPTPVEDEKTAKKKAKMEEGVTYNVPARAFLKIYNPSKVFCEEEVSMGQFGNTEILSNALFDKKTTTQVLLYQNNGGIEKLTAQEPE